MGYGIAGAAGSDSDTALEVGKLFRRIRLIRVSGGEVLIEKGSEFF